MTRCVHTLSRWGETYRRRYYVNGKRVVEPVFDFELEPLLQAGVAHTVETKGGLVRYTWESKQ